MTLIHAMVANPSNDPRKHAPGGKKVKWRTKPPSSSWDQIKNMLTCKQIDEMDSKSIIHVPSKNPHPRCNYNVYSTTACTKVCCRLRRDAVSHANTRIAIRADKSPENYCGGGGGAVGQETRLLSHKSSYGGGSSSSLSVRSGSSRGLQLRKLSGCYECHSVVDPTRYPLPSNSPRIISACSECGEVFPEIESFEHHQAIMHAVSELGPEDSSRDIVEIIFKSSWLKRDSPICQIERILKVHNTHRTIQRFEDYRDSVKARANINNAVKRNARCAADGNELLRFHSATLACSLGARGSSSLCASVPACGVCTVIRHGFQGNGKSGIRTTATSGRAHDCLGGGCGTRGAMLVCRVIAGKVKRVGEVAAAEEDGSAAHVGGSYDSLAGCAGLYSNIEELHVFNSRAILPCFVVIYKALES